MKRGQHKSAHRWRVMGAFGKGSKRKFMELTASPAASPGVGRDRQEATERHVSSGRGCSLKHCGDSR